MAKGVPRSALEDKVALREAAIAVCRRALGCGRAYGPVHGAYEQGGAGWGWVGCVQGYGEGPAAPHRGLACR